MNDQHSMMPDGDEKPLLTVALERAHEKYPRRVVSELSQFSNGVACVTFDGGGTRFVHRDGRMWPDDWVGTSRLL